MEWLTKLQQRLFGENVALKEAERSHTPDRETSSAATEQLLFTPKTRSLPTDRLGHVLTLLTPYPVTTAHQDIARSFVSIASMLQPHYQVAQQGEVSKQTVSLRTDHWKLACTITPHEYGSLVFFDTDKKPGLFSTPETEDLTAQMMLMEQDLVRHLEHDLGAYAGLSSGDVIRDGQHTTQVALWSMLVDMSLADTHHMVDQALKTVQDIYTIIPNDALSWHLTDPAKQRNTVLVALHESNAPIVLMVCALAIDPASRAMATGIALYLCSMIPVMARMAPEESTVLAQPQQKGRPAGTATIPPRSPLMPEQWEWFTGELLAARQTRGKLKQLAEQTGIEYENVRRWSKQLTDGEELTPLWENHNSTKTQKRT